MTWVTVPPEVLANTITKIEVTPRRFGHWVRVTIGIRYACEPCFVFGSQARALEVGKKRLAKAVRRYHREAAKVTIRGTIEPAEYVPAPNPLAPVKNSGIGNSSRAHGEMIVRVAKALCAAQNGPLVWDLLEPWGRASWISEAADIVADPADAQWGETS